MALSGVAVAGVVLLGLAGAAVYDLQRVQRETLIVYTTAALRDLLEKDIVPRFEADGGAHVQLIYTAAGQQFTRLRLSGDEPEADVFLHASPLFIEKGNEEGFFRSFNLTQGASVPPTMKSAAGPEGNYWFAFGWSPLVEVFSPSFDGPPDIATAQVKFGLPHPKLSNNGVYNAFVLESVDGGVGARIVDETVVQPVNARATISGVADKSFEVTMGYEAVTQFYQDQGAKVKYGPITINGEPLTTPVLFCAATVRGPHNEAAQRLVRFMFEPTSQAHLAKFHIRSTVGAVANESMEITGVQTRVLNNDWADWKTLEGALSRYEVKSGGYR